MQKPGDLSRVLHDFVWLQCFPVLPNPPAPLVCRSVRGFGEGGVFDLVEDHLGYFFRLFLFRSCFLVQVDQDHADLAAVGGVYGAGGVQDGDAVLEGESGFGADLAFVAVRDGHLEAGGDQHALAGFQHVVMVE